MDFLPLQQGINIVVGDNEAGKSTILEAINLVLTGITGNKYLRNNLSPYLFNNDVVSEFISELNNGNNPELPSFLIELFFSVVSYWVSEIRHSIIVFDRLLAQLPKC